MSDSRVYHAIMPEPQPSSIRERLAAVVSRAGPLITVPVTSEVLHLPRNLAAKTLARWEQQGWLRRIRRGVYASVPLDTLAREQVIADPWILVPRLFDPAYIAGWSAAEHWELTEQIFRSVCVVTGRMVRPREQTIQGVPFIFRHLAPERIFGTRTVWRDDTKVQVSDLHRTIVDMLDEPSIGGGIRHVDDCLGVYLGRPDADLEQVIAYAEQLGNGAVFKRLGFLLARHDSDEQWLARCAERLTEGNAKLDPTVPCPRLVRRWRVWVPESWKERRAA
jgi:predicted transcriptional regulator of viral defense system